jgi:plastocyanin
MKRLALGAGAGVAVMMLGAGTAAFCFGVAPRTSSAGAAAAVTGKATYAGAASAGLHTITKNPEVCGAPAPKVEEVVLGAGGGLANVVVSLAAPAPAGAPKAMTVTVNQKGCRYDPHVQAATVGSDVVIKNSDTILHNVHGFLDGTATLFNVGMPMKDMTVKKKLKGPGVVSFKCDAGHTWMSAYIVTFAHPWFTVSGADGTFKLEGVPAGTWTATFWHEKLGKKTSTVVVPASGEVAANIAF